MSLLSPGGATSGLTFGELTSMGLPWPKGDPGAIRAAAGRLRTVPTELAATSTRLTAASQHDGVWDAAASKSFAAAVSGLKAELSRGQGELDGAARAVDRLAIRLQASQDRVRRLDEKVRRAKVNADALRLQADTAASLAFDARRGQLGGGPSGDAAGQDSAAKERLATGAETEYETVWRKARADAQQECDGILELDKSTARIVGDVATSAPFGGASFTVPPLPTSRLANHVAPHYAPILRHDSEEEVYPDGVPFAYKPGPDGKGIQFDFWPRYTVNDHWEPTTLSDHDGDFERISVQLDGQGNLDVVATEAHGAQQGKRRADDMDRQGDQPILYPGRGSHATYPDRGTNIADNAFPSPDLTDGKGREVDTRPMVNDMRTEPELNTGDKVETRDSPVDQIQDRPLPEDLDSLERSDGAAPELPEPPVIPRPLGPLPNLIP